MYRYVNKMENVLSKHNRMARNFINNQIRGDKVLCIDHNNNNLGIIPKRDALNIANDNDLDLVQVSMSKNNIPTCKILDYGKYKFNQSKRLKLQAKKQREAIIKTKEIKFRPCTGINDLDIKAKKAVGFLEKDFKLKITINFKGRENINSGVAIERLNIFLDLVNEHSKLGFVEMQSNPKMDKRSMNVFLVKSG